jgi:ABC-type transporter Mla subunit MlaD
MSDFLPPKDWSPDDETDPAVELQKILQGQQLLIENHNEQIRRLIEISQAIHERQENIVAAVNALHEFLQQVAATVRGLRALQELQDATKPTHPSL